MVDRRQTKKDPEESVSDSVRGSKLIIIVDSEFLFKKFILHSSNDLSTCYADLKSYIEPLSEDYHLIFVSLVTNTNHSLHMDAIAKQFSLKTIRFIDSMAARTAIMALQLNAYVLSDPANMIYFKKMALIQDHEYAVLFSNVQAEFPLIREDRLKIAADLFEYFDDLKKPNFHDEYLFTVNPYLNKYSRYLKESLVMEKFIYFVKIMNATKEQLDSILGGDRSYPEGCILRLAYDKISTLDNEAHVDDSSEANVALAIEQEA